MEMRKFGVFVGVFLVGVLMLSLVAGAGYNVVVPSTDPPSTGGSSGGGGGGVVANVTDNVTVSGDVVVEDDDKVDIVEKGKEIIENIIETTKGFWIWFSVGAILVVVALAVYFKRKKK